MTKLYKTNKSKSPKINKFSSKKKRTPKSPRVNKIIQGGGYYEPLEHTTTFEQSGGVFINSNFIMVIILVLILIIGYLVYININTSSQTLKINLDEEVNTELLKEAELLRNHKINNLKNSNSNSSTKDLFINNDANHKNNTNHKNNKENYHGIFTAHPQYDLGHRLVGYDADNPHMIPIMPKIMDHNIERIINPLLPPERSYVSTYGIPTNIPSRGFSGGYQQVGSLSKTEISDENSLPGNNNKSVILPIFGQPVYPGSHKWNYYTTTDKNAMVKMTFKVSGKDSDDRHGVNELMSGDQVQIPEYNGNFDVKIYQFDQPKYIPFIY